MDDFIINDPLSLRDKERESKKLLKHARELREQATKAEQMLWKYLRGRRLNGYKFRRQVVIEPYIVDFVCLKSKLIVEADGGQHSEQQEYDALRTKRLEGMGYRVLRFWNNDILRQHENVLEYILSVLTNKT